MSAATKTKQPNPDQIKSQFRKTLNAEIRHLTRLLDQLDEGRLPLLEIEFEAMQRQGVQTSPFYKIKAACASYFQPAREAYRRSLLRAGEQEAGADQLHGAAYGPE